MLPELSEDDEMLIRSKETVAFLASYATDELALAEYKKKFAEGPGKNPSFLFDSVKLELMELRQDITDLSKSIGWLIQHQERKTRRLETQLWTSINLLTFLSQVVQVNEQAKQGMN